MSKLFDTQALLMEEMEANATRRDPLPPGEVIARISKLAFSEGKIKDGDRKGETWNRLDVTLEIEDRDYLQRYSDGTMEKATTVHGIMFDKNAAGKIATGPNVNVRLGKFREAAGVNGKPLQMLVGQFVRIVVEQEKDPNDPDPDAMRDKITGFAKV